MSDYVSDIAFTPAVKAAQERLGSRAGYARMEEKGGWQDKVTNDLAAFLAERDSLYLATASAEGQPYIQHRGGPRGFLRVLDDQTLALADFRGNRQLITVGNLATNDRVALMLMDYNRRERLKILGHAKVADARADEDLARKLIPPDYPGKVERVFIIRVAATDWNCPQHIRPR